MFRIVRTVRIDTGICTGFEFPLPFSSHAHNCMACDFDQNYQAGSRQSYVGFSTIHILRWVFFQLIPFRKAHAAGGSAQLVMQGRCSVQELMRCVNNRATR